MGEPARIPATRLPRKCMSSWWVYAAKPPRGKTREEAGMHGRPVGAPEFTWGRMIGKALRYVGIDRGRWYQLAQNKPAWDTMIEWLGKGTGMSTGKPSKRDLRKDRCKGRLTDVRDDCTLVGSLKKSNA